MFDVFDVIFVVVQLCVLVVGGGSFFVYCIYCVGCNFVDYVCEMGVVVLVVDDCGCLMFFSKLVDVIVVGYDDVIFYLLVIVNLYYEVELVVVIGCDVFVGELVVVDVDVLVYGYVVGLDLICCDLQVVVKDKGYLWDVVKGFDVFVLISEIVYVEEVGDLVVLNLLLEVNGEVCQQVLFDQMIWNVLEILYELFKLWQLCVGDLVFMGILFGVVVLKFGDCFSVCLENVVECYGVIVG